VLGRAAEVMVESPAFFQALASGDEPGRSEDWAVIAAMQEDMLALRNSMLGLQRNYNEEVNPNMCRRAHDPPNCGASRLTFQLLACDDSSAHLHKRLDMYHYTSWTQSKSQQQAAYRKNDAAQADAQALGAQIREAVIAASRRVSRLSNGGNGDGSGGQNTDGGAAVVDGLDLQELENQLARILSGGQAAE